MTTVCTKMSLTPQRRRFLEHLQVLNFGRVESLRIVGGEPVLDPPPRTIVEYKFAFDTGHRPELALDDFVLKAPVVELFAHFDRIQSGVIDSLEIRHGMPFR